jgi:hypothetical protein
MIRGLHYFVGKELNNMNEFASKLKKLITCTAILLVIVGCTKAEEKEARPDIKTEKILARVDKDPIFEDEIVRRIKVAHGIADISTVEPNQWQRMTEAALESEIIDRLLLNAATHEGMAADSEGVDQLLNRSKTMLGEEKFQEMLKKRNSTEKEYREFLEKRSLIKQYKEKLFAGIIIDEDALKRSYEGNEQSFVTPEKVRLEVLVVRNPEDADEIYQKVKAGEAFDKVAQEYSKAGKEVSLRRTGLTRSDTVPRAIQLKVRASDTGDIIGPAKIENKINIYKVLGRQPSRVLTYEEAIQGSRSLFLKRTKSHD